MKLKAINKNREFNKAYKKGKSYVSSLLVVYVIKSRYPFLRLGITTSKKVGNAVKRNRARRLLKESFRLLDVDKNLNLDIILVARSKTPYSDMNKVKKEMQKLLKQAGVLLDD